MGYPTKVQLIMRKRGVDQWYINFPTPLAQAMNFRKSEVVEWTIVDKGHMVLSRRTTPDDPVEIKKKRSRASSNTSSNSGNRQSKASSRKRST